jgi:hypothetical protein
VRCLVLMPFRPEFNNVFECAKAAVTQAVDSKSIECYWLKDVHVAGQITVQIQGS